MRKSCFCWYIVCPRAIAQHFTRFIRLPIKTCIERSPSWCTTGRISKTSSMRCTFACGALFTAMMRNGRFDTGCTELPYAKSRIGKEKRGAECGFLSGLASCGKKSLTGQTRLSCAPRPVGGTGKEDCTLFRQTESSEGKIETSKGACPVWIGSFFLSCTF